MHARLRQLRLRSVRTRAYAQALAALGAVAAVAGIPAAIWSSNPALRGGSVAAGVVAMVANAVRTLPRAEAHRSHPDNDARITITDEDLLAIDGETIVVTVNTHFDVDQNAVSGRSLVHQLIDRWYAGDEAPLRAALGIPDGSPGRTEPAPIGTIEAVSAGPQRALLLAVTTRDGTTSSAVAVNDVWVALTALWEHARVHRVARLSVPIIGAGMSNARIDRASLLVLLITSYLAASEEQRDVPPLRIVLHGTPEKVLGLMELATDFCDKLGFVTASGPDL